jgi:hypothetical protein
LAKLGPTRAQEEKFVALFKPVTRDTVDFVDEPVSEGKYSATLRLTRAELQAALAEMDAVGTPFTFAVQYNNPSGVLFDITGAHSAWTLPVSQTTLRLHMGRVRARELRDFLNAQDLGDKVYVK